MVNGGVVNGKISHFLPATFCEFFADSGRILRLENAVKYARRFEINCNTAPAPLGRAFLCRNFARRINGIAQLKAPLRRVSYNGTIKENARHSNFWGKASKKWG